MNIIPFETGPASMTVEPFAVETRFMRITVTMPKASAEFLTRQSEFIQFDLGNVVGVYAARAEISLNAKTATGEASLAERRTEIERFGYPQGTGLLPVTIELRAAYWESVQAVAAGLGVEAVHVIRAALHVRIIELEKFHATQEAAGDR